MSRDLTPPEPRQPTLVCGCEVVIRIAKQELPLPLKTDEKGRALVDIEGVVKLINEFKEQGVG